MSSSALEAMSTLNERLMTSWVVSPDLFGDIGWDIYDFEAGNWVYFLDNVKSLEDLLRGLRELNPLADDALEAAEQMSKQDFRKFKKIIAKERQRENQVVPHKYRVLLFPKRFIPAALLVEKFAVPLGTAIIRTMEMEYEEGK